MFNNCKCGIVRENFGIGWNCRVAALFCDSSESIAPLDGTMEKQLASTEPTRIHRLPTDKILITSAPVVRIVTADARNSDRDTSTTRMEPAVQSATLFSRAVEQDRQHAVALSGSLQMAVRVLHSSLRVYASFTNHLQTPRAPLVREHAMTKSIPWS